MLLLTGRTATVCSSDDNMRTVAAILLGILLTLPAQAEQDPPKPDAPAQQKAEEKKEEPAQEEAEKPPPRPKDFSLELGLGAWGLSGNERKFRQYATPPKGLFLKDLRWSPLATTDRYSLIALKGIGGTDYRGDGALSFSHGRTQLEGWFGRNAFFDPTPALIRGSERAIHEGYVKQFVGGGFSLSTRYRMDTQNHFFDIPKEPNHQRTRYTDFIGAGRLGPGQVRLSLTDWQFFDRTEQLLDTKTSRVMLNYLWEASPTVGLEAAAGRASIKQPGAPSFDVNLFSLVGDFVAGPATDVVVGLHRDSQGTPVTQNAYTRENRSASARVIHRWSRWTGQLALQGREAERVRGDQSFVDVPRWATLEGRVSGRISRDWRLSVRGYTQSLSKAPPMVTQDRRNLLIDGRRFAQIKLDGGKPELNGYLTWTNSTVENSTRDVRVTANLLTLGGNWEAAPALSVFAELTRENWTGKSEIVG